MLRTQLTALAAVLFVSTTLASACSDSKKSGGSGGTDGSGGSSAGNGGDGGSSGDGGNGGGADGGSNGTGATGGGGNASTGGSGGDAGAAGDTGAAGEAGGGPEPTQECGGDAMACDDLDDEEACNAQQGCAFQAGACEPIQCEGLMPDSCDAQMDCEWDEDANACVATPDNDCSAGASEEACGDLPACTWRTTDTCIGAAVSCEDLDLSECESQAGCSL